MPCSAWIRRRRNSSARKTGRCFPPATGKQRSTGTPSETTACCGGCRALAVRDHPTDYLAKDLYTCEYFKGGWKEKKEALLKSIGR